MQTSDYPVYQSNLIGRHLRTQKGVEVEAPLPRSTGTRVRVGLG